MYTPRPLASLGREAKEEDINSEKQKLYKKRKNENEIKQENQNLLELRNELN